MEFSVPSEHDFNKSREEAGQGAESGARREGAGLTSSPETLLQALEPVLVTAPLSAPSCPAPTLTAQGLVRYQNLGSSRVQPGLPIAPPLPKGERASLGGCPAPSQLPKCSAPLMKGPPLPLFSALRSNLSSPLITNSKHIESGPGHQRTKACALPAECALHSWGDFYRRRNPPNKLLHLNQTMPEVTARRPALMTQLAAGFSMWKLYRSMAEQPAALPSLAARSLSCSRTRKLTLCVCRVSVS